MFAILATIIILLIVALYLLVYYQHPDDHNDAWGPKFVVLFGFVLAGWTVMLFPLDVANNEGYSGKHIPADFPAVAKNTKRMSSHFISFFIISFLFPLPDAICIASMIWTGCDGYDTKFCGGLNMEAFWDAIFWLIPIWVFVLIPFSTFFYEADDGTLMMGTAYGANHVRKSRLASACCYQLFVFVIVGAFFLIMYLVFNETNIPVEDYQSTLTIRQLLNSDQNVHDYPDLVDSTGNPNATFTVNGLADMDADDARFYGSVANTGSETLTLQVSVSVFFGGLMAWLGWWLFSLFGGVGLAAMPMDLILTYRDRPRHLDPVEFAEAQMSLRERVNELVDIGELIKIEREQKASAGIVTSGWSLDGDKRKAARDENQAILGFKQAFFLLEKDVEDFQAMSSNYENYNPLIPYISLVLGVCACIMSVFWFLHIIIYVYPDPPLAPFLNNYFEWFDNWFPLFGVLSVALFTSYLLFCAVKGCFKFGVRFMFFQIHPMRVGKTYMSSFMFNIALVLLCALPVVQFAQEAFSEYAAYSTIRQIFGVQVQYLDFFQWFFTKKIFIYILMGVAFLSGLYLWCRPRDQAANPEALRDRLKAHRQG